MFSRYMLLVGVLTMLVGCQVIEGDVSSAAAESALPPLYWSPPELENPITIDVPSDSGSNLQLEDNQDYIINLPDEPVNGNLIISGGRNIVLIGGEINIPWQGESDDPPIRPRTGLTIYNMTGTLHVEGLLIRGEDLSEGIQIGAPDAIIQLQNIAIVDIQARDQVEFTDNHPDLIQTFGNVVELRVDRFSGSTDYQGFFFKDDFSDRGHGAVHLRNVDISGLPTARYLFWIEAVTWVDGEPQNVVWDGPVTLHNVWVNPHENREGGLGDSLWPPAHWDYPTGVELFNNEDGILCGSWSEDMHITVNGYICEGLPPEGNFVNVEDVGVGYISPGYQNE